MPTDQGTRQTRKDALLTYHESSWSDSLEPNRRSVLRARGALLVLENVLRAKVVLGSVQVQQAGALTRCRSLEQRCGPVLRAGGACVVLRLGLAQRTDDWLALESLPFMGSGSARQPLDSVPCA